MIRTVLLVALLAACGRSSGPPPNAARGPVVVRTIEAREEATERIVEITGTLAGAEEVTVSAEVEGRVERVAADLGDVVPRGGLLVQLQAAEARLLAEQADADYQQALARLGVDEAGLDKVDPQNSAAVQRAAADLEEARRNTARVLELYKKAVVTQNDLDTVQTRERVAETALQAAREEAAAAKALARSKRAALGLARKRLADTSVSSPVQGVVSERLVSIGELVRVGQPVARVVTTNPLKLKGDVPERYAGSVKVDAPVTVVVDALGTELKGKIARVGPAVATTSRTFRVEALVEDPDGRARPGLFARGRLSIGDVETVIAVPEIALSSVAGVTKVFVLEDGKARERRVDVLRKRGSNALLTGEIRQGDRVITTAIARLFDGADVAVDGEPARAEARPPQGAGG